MMLRSRWPGTGGTVTLDGHCPLAPEVPAKANVALARLLTNVGFVMGRCIFVPVMIKRTVCKMLQNVSLLNPPIVAPDLFWCLQCREGGDQPH